LLGNVVENRNAPVSMGLLEGMANKDSRRRSQSTHQASGTGQRTKSGSGHRSKEPIGQLDVIEDM